MTFYYKTWFIIFLLALTTSLFFLVLYLADVTTQSEITAVRKPDTSALTQERTSYAGYKEGVPSRGDKDANLYIIEFADFQCPFCKEASIIFDEIFSTYSNDMYFQFRHFSLSTLHPQAQAAAEASMCAYEQGKFWEFHDAIFKEQHNLSEPTFFDALPIPGMERAAFAECLQSKKYAAEVDADFNEGKSLGVSATPTFFINGQKVQGVIPKQVLVDLIEKLR